MRVACGASIVTLTEPSQDHTLDMHGAGRYALQCGSRPSNSLLTGLNWAGTPNFVVKGVGDPQQMLADFLCQDQEGNPRPRRP